MTNTEQSHSPTKIQGACLHAASASDYSTGKRSRQAPSLVPAEPESARRFAHSVYILPIYTRVTYSACLAARSYSTSHSDSRVINKDGKSSVRNSIEGGLCGSGARSTWLSFSLISPQLLRDPARSLAPFAFPHPPLPKALKRWLRATKASSSPLTVQVVARSVTTTTSVNHPLTHLPRPRQRCSAL
jgi:hypothetical protein